MLKKRKNINQNFETYNKLGGLEAPPEKILQIKFQPPAIYGVSVLISLILNYFFIYFKTNISHLLPIGFLIVLFSIFINMWSMNKYRFYKTSPHPKHQPQKLITDGPYKYSRNPLYLGTFLMIFGFGIASDILLMSISAIFSLILIHFFVILPEEEYLTDLFGNSFFEYKKQVRRWL